METHKLIYRLVIANYEHKNGSTAQYLVLPSWATITAAIFGGFEGIKVFRGDIMPGIVSHRHFQKEQFDFIWLQILD